MVNRDKLAKEIEAEIGLKVAKDLEVKRGTAKFSEEVVAVARKIWDESGHMTKEGHHAYEHGNFRESIHAEKRRDRGRWPHWWVGSRHPKVHMLEYGTDVDRPGTHSPWGRFTPTPAFAIFARTAIFFRGTPDGEGEG